MNRHLCKPVLAAALMACLASASAVPTPPLSCAGVPGVGGCAPYLNIALSDAAGALNLYEYDLPGMHVGRSLTLSDAQGNGDLQLARLGVSARQALDGNPSSTQSVDVGMTLVDLFTLHSAGGLPSGASVGITVMATAQGVGSIDTDYQVVQSLLHLGFGSGVLGYGGGVLDAGSVLQSVTHVPTFQQFLVPLQVYAGLTVQVGVPFELSTSLRAIVTESSFLNFDSFLGLARGAQLSFALPPGFSVTSMGGFDSASPVPEPEALPMWLAGLGMLGLAMRRLRGSGRGVGLAALLSAMVSAGPAQAGLLGDSVSAELVNQAGGGSVTTPFAATAVVGAGAEFTGVWTYAPLNQVWQVVLDLEDSSFTVTFTDVGGGNNHDLSGFTFLGLRLGDLDTGGRVSGVSILSSPGAAVQSMGYSDHGITLQWNGFLFRDAAGAPLAGGSSVFGIQTTTAVPEPGSAALLLAGLAGLALATRRRR